MRPFVPSAQAIEALELCAAHMTLQDAKYLDEQAYYNLQFPAFTGPLGWLVKADECLSKYSKMSKSFKKCIKLAQHHKYIYILFDRSVEPIEDPAIDIDTHIW
jgi:hypothetical protein